MTDRLDPISTSRFSLFIKKYIFFRVPIYLAFHWAFYLFWPMPEDKSKMHAWLSINSPILLFFSDSAYANSFGLAISFFFSKKDSAPLENGIRSLIEFSPVILLIIWYLFRASLLGAFIALTYTVLLISLGEGLQFAWNWLIIRNSRSRV